MKTPLPGLVSGLLKNWNKSTKWPDLRGLITFLLVNLGSNQDVAEEALEPDAPLQLYTLRFLAILWCKTHFLLTSQLKYLNISMLSQLIFFFFKPLKSLNMNFIFRLFLSCIIDSKDFTSVGLDQPSVQLNCCKEWVIHTITNKLLESWLAADVISKWRYFCIASDSKQFWKNSTIRDKRRKKKGRISQPPGRVKLKKAKM